MSECLHPQVNLDDPYPHEDCDQCQGSGVLGHYSHVDPATGEHLGDQDIPCPTCQGTGLKP